MYCIKCGIQLPDDAQFCDNCGSQQRTQEERQAAPQVPLPPPTPPPPTVAQPQARTAPPKWNPPTSPPLPPPKKSRTGCIIAWAFVAAIAFFVAVDKWGTDDSNRAIPTTRPVPTRTATTPRPTVPPRTPTPAKPSIEILDISSKDMGLGDGSVYVYVDVINNTNRLYESVWLNGTCRNASDQVVGTGIGSSSNVGPGERSTVTIMMLQVPDCDTIHVEVDPLTEFL